MNGALLFRPIQEQAKGALESVLVIAALAIQLPNQRIPMPLDAFPLTIGKPFGLLMHLGNRRL